MQIEAEDDAMSKLNKIFFALCLLMGAHTMAYAQGKQSESRGELLYTTHCNSCHTSKIHWREQKLASDWNSLVVQVRRWQGISGLNWNDEEVADVANYLNAVFYKYINTAQIKNQKQYLIKQ